MNILHIFFSCFPFFFALMPTHHNPLTASLANTTVLRHVGDQSEEKRCKSASLRMLSKLNGDDVLFICEDSPASEPQQEKNPDT